MLTYYTTEWHPYACCSCKKNNHIIELDNQDGYLSLYDEDLNIISYDIRYVSVNGYLFECGYVHPMQDIYDITELTMTPEDGEIKIIARCEEETVHKYESGYAYIIGAYSSGGIRNSSPDKIELKNITEVVKSDKWHPVEGYDLYNPVLLYENIDYYDRDSNEIFVKLRSPKTSKIFYAVLTSD